MKRIAITYAYALIDIDTPIDTWALATKVFSGPEASKEAGMLIANLNAGNGEVVYIGGSN